MSIADKYGQLCATPSDINELLPYLVYYTAFPAKRITEFGTRRCVSAYAFLLGRPLKFTTYDIHRYPEVDELEALGRAEGLNITFHLQDVLRTEIEETDILFIDTFHTAEQCWAELQKHTHKVSWRIIFHDVHTYWEKAEDPYEGVIGPGTGRGLKYAIEPFLQAHPEWQVIFRTNQNNGLLVLEKEGYAG